MLQPNLRGSMAHNIHAAPVDFLTADLALIDSDIYSKTYLPYAYTATVADDSDGVSYTIATAAQAIADDQKVALGLYLSADNEKGNLVFNLQGSVSARYSANDVSTFFIFGRRDGAVTSTKAGTANQLGRNIILPLDTISQDDGLVFASINQSIIIQCDTTDTAVAYCFALVMENETGGAVTAKMESTLSMQKYSWIEQTHDPAYSV